MQDYETLIIATDLSDPALPAVRHGGSLARRLGSKILLVYVMEDRVPQWLSKSDLAEIMDRHRQHADEALAACIQENLSGDEVEPVVLQGSPHDEIVKLARDRRVKMIVLGMHGHGFLTHALAGSTAERVLHDAPCPVLVVSHSH